MSSDGVSPSMWQVVVNDGSEWSTYNSSKEIPYQSWMSEEIGFPPDHASFAYFCAQSYPTLKPNQVAMLWAFYTANGFCLLNADGSRIRRARNATLTSRRRAFLP